MLVTLILLIGRLHRERPLATLLWFSSLENSTSLGGGFGIDLPQGSSNPTSR